jgi:predicted MFS family arabinose efflux permease
VPDAHQPRRAGRATTLRPWRRASGATRPPELRRASGATTPPQLRRARGAASLIFFLTGAVFATWAARIPAVQERLDLSPGGLSVALVGMEAGALVGLTAGGRVVAALGSPPSLRLGFVVYPPALVAVAQAPDLAVLVAALAVMGAANSVIDVAMNVQGVELERRYARPLLSGLHSAHSFGVLAGGLAGTLLAAQDVTIVAHFVIAAAIALAASQAAIGWLIRDRAGRSDAGRAGPDTAGRAGRDTAGRAGRRRLTLPERPLAMLGLLAFGAFFVEGAANDWSAVHLRSVHAGSPALAAGAFTAFSLALALGRTVSDRLVARHGRATVTRAAALTAAVGAALVVLAPSASIAIVGWSVLGAGMAPIAPALLGAAPDAGTAAAPAAIATVSTIGYAGSFAGPPIIGALAELTGLPAALVLLIAGALAIAVLTRGALTDDAARAHRASAHDSRDIAPAPLQYYDPEQRTTGP